VALLQWVRFYEGPTYSRTDLDTVVAHLFPELEPELTS
jgi:hypothetical protein